MKTPVPSGSNSEIICFKNYKKSSSGTSKHCKTIDTPIYEQSIHQDLKIHSRGWARDSPCRRSLFHLFEFTVLHLTTRYWVAIIVFPAIKPSFDSLTVVWPPLFPLHVEEVAVSHGIQASQNIMCIISSVMEIFRSDFKMLAYYFESFGILRVVTFQCSKKVGHVDRKNTFFRDRSGKIREQIRQRRLDGFGLEVIEI